MAYSVQKKEAKRMRIRNYWKVIKMNFEKAYEENNKLTVKQLAIKWHDVPPHNFISTMLVKIAQLLEEIRDGKR
jgi:uncharacterized Fe-S radical SAM superfamily protein PflX